MTKFIQWLKERDPQLAEGFLGKAGALAMGMGGALAGGAAGLMAGGPLAAIPGWVGGKYLGTKAAERVFPKDTLELSKKKMKAK